MSLGDPLNRREFDEVMRRAADLAAAEPDSAEEGFRDAEVVRIAREAGLAERHVRRALADVRTGRSLRAGRRYGGFRELFGNGTVHASRTINQPRARIIRELDEFMVAGQLLQRVRRKNDLLQYRPAIDWASRVARAASSTSRKHYVAAARLVEISLEALDGRSTLVKIDVDPGIINNYRTGAILGGTVVGAVVGLGAGATISALFALAPLTLTAGSGMIAGAGAALIVAMLTGWGFWRRIGEVQSEVEGILDGLESGTGLEPPPPAWRRWVQRHFHGVAREMMGSRRE